VNNPDLWAINWNEPVQLRCFTKENTQDILNYQRRLYLSLSSLPIN